jgi:hypothetical protein
VKAFLGTNILGYAQESGRARRRRARTGCAGMISGQILNELA